MPDVVGALVGALVDGAGTGVGYPHNLASTSLAFLVNFLPITSSRSDTSLSAWIRVDVNNTLRSTKVRRKDFMF